MQETTGLDQSQSGAEGVSFPALLDLIVDVWRIQRRSARDSGTSSGVRVACEVAMDRVALLGFVVDEMIGKAYDPSMRVRVVDTAAGPGPAQIVECLSPAIYRDGRLVRQAEVVIMGESGGGSGAADR